MNLDSRQIIGTSALVAVLLGVVVLVAMWSGGAESADAADETSTTVAAATEDPASTTAPEPAENTTERLSYVWWGPAGSLSVDDQSEEAPDYRYVIPLGTGDAIEAGQEVDVLPAELEVRVGETIEIINEDDQPHFIGPFTVFQGESLRQRFSEPGESLGTCSAHVLGSVRVVVNEA